MKFLSAVYPGNRLFPALVGAIVLFFAGYFMPGLYWLAWVWVGGMLAMLGVDIVYLFGKKPEIFCRRAIPEKLSNGDDNEILLYVENRSSKHFFASVFDGVPAAFQHRGPVKSFSIKPSASYVLNYTVHPVRRGEYLFGLTRLMLYSPVQMLGRRMVYNSEQVVSCYPSFLQMRKYELIAISQRLTMYGIKRIRRIGHQHEFDQIREYVTGDDYRTINWKATARRDQLMVNLYQDERSQQVYCLVDLGRNMLAPFDGMTLVDYAVNASLTISNVARIKEDKPGLITFSHRLQQFVPASSKPRQIFHLAEALYRVMPQAQENNLESLSIHVKRKISQRSLLLLFTNFERRISLMRQMPYLRAMAKNHLLVVIFFENTELQQLIHTEPRNLRDLYYKTVAERLQFEKRMCVKDLQMHGIQAVLTTPQNLTIDTLNKYLEIKARGIL